jgi:hypothetical protein
MLSCINTNYFSLRFQELEVPAVPGPFYINASDIYITPGMRRGGEDEERGEGIIGGGGLVGEQEVFTN